MPDPWYFEHLDHDSGDADFARGQLATAAASLAEALRIIEEDIPVIVEDWFGQARSTFDTEMPGILQAGHELLATLYAGVSAVAYYDEIAANESALRRWLRLQWYDEHPPPRRVR